MRQEGGEASEKIEENLLNIVEKEQQEIKEEIEKQKKLTFYLETKKDETEENSSISNI